MLPRFWALCLLVCLGRAPVLVRAQDPGATVRGSVQDQTGAVVPAVRVAIIDATGAVQAQTRTDASGGFVFTDVPPGTYELHTEFKGFKPAMARLRVVHARNPPAQHLVLELAAITQEITIGGEANSIGTAADANRDAIALDPSALKDLPIFDRDIVGAATRFLDPAALGDGGVSLVVDGMEVRKVGVSPSAIQQIRVNQDPYSAEFARPGRGRVEVVTKAGSDAYHGSFDFTGRDAHLNARDAFATSRPPEQRRIYEGVLGGPVRGGKQTSFLTTVERREEDLQSIVFAYGPSGPIHGIVPRPDRRTELSSSLSHQRGASQTISVRFTGEWQASRNHGVGGLTLPESASDDHADEEQLVFGHRWVATRRLVNDLRILVGRELQQTASVRPGPRLIVLDAFTSGGAENDAGQSEYHVQIAQAATYSRGRHLLKAGFAIPDWSRRGFDDRSNRDGTFTFASLDDYGLGQPLSFAQQRGDGRLVFLQKVIGGFVQEQMTVGRNLSIGAGVRYEWQNLFGDNNNVAPRGSFAWAVGRSTVVRGGAGVFYERGGDGVIREVLRSRDDRLIRLLLLEPPYPDPFASVSVDGAPVTSLVRLAPDVHMPMTTQYGVGIEHQVHKGTTVAVNYIGSRGASLLRSVDINAPVPPLYAIRPDPGFGSIRQIQSTARQHTDSVQFTLRGRMAPRVQGSAQYTLGFAHNDTSGINALPANNHDVSSEWGRTDFDQRHKLDLLAALKGGPWFNLGLSVSLASGRPYSVRTGHDDFHTGQTNARPAGVARNTLQGPGYASVDLRWSKAIALGAAAKERHRAMTIGVDAFNVLNRVNFSSYVGNLMSPFFGRATSAQPPRRIQLAAGVTF